MKIEALSNYRRDRNPNGYFEDLPADVRFRARRWLAELLEHRGRLGKPTPQWTIAILIGQAKRLAKQSKEERSAWGRSMLAKRGATLCSGATAQRAGSLPQRLQGAA